MSYPALPVPADIHVERVRCPDCYGTRLDAEGRGCQTCNANGRVDMVTCPVHEARVPRDIETGELLASCPGCAEEAEQGIALIEGPH